MLTTMESTFRTPPRPTVYPSEIDLWIAIMLMISPLITAGLGMWMLLEGNLWDAGILFGTTLLVGLTSVIFTLPCRYTIETDVLRIRCGVVGYRLPLADIERIEKSGSWLSAPALSLERVLVATKRRKCLISPIDRDTFIIDLRKAVSDAKQRNQTITT